MCFAYRNWLPHTNSRIALLIGQASSRFLLVSEQANMESGSVSTDYDDMIMSRIFNATLILLWTYTGLDKLIRWESSRKAFLNQPMPNELEEILAFAIPGIELSIVLLLLFSATRWWGYLGSILLLTVFTTYVGLIWVGAFPRVPCNCAGILESLGWAEHFVLNMICIVMAILGLRFEKLVPRVGLEDCKIGKFMGSSDAR